MYVYGLETLFSCKGYHVEYGRTDGEIMQINLAVDRRFSFKCPDCHCKMSVNRTSYSLVRDMPISSIKDVLIRVPIRQGRCWRCDKTHTFKPEFVAVCQKVTNRLLRYVAAFCQYLSATKVAEYFGVCDNTIRNWNQKYLKAALKEPDFDNLQYLLVDEKSIGKGHSYVTVVLNALNGELLHMAEGKKHESLKSFFDKLTNEQKCRIRAVCIDRNGTYATCIKEHLGHAQIAYDKFHLVKNLNDVIDKIRIDLWHQARREGDRTSAEIIKGQKYNLLRNRKNNTETQQRRLDELLKVNAPLSEAYLLLESFKHTLPSIDRVQMHKDLIDWIQMAGRSCRKEMRKFAKNLSEVVENVVNAAKYKLNNGLIERFNGKIAMVIRRACGCQNLDYLFLNLRQLAKKPIPL